MQDDQDEQQSCSTSPSTVLAESLLFFDTFSHTVPENNFDLVQFPSPVIIDLIKIVPLGQPIEAKIPGNVRLGATNPSNCRLEFFINDLTKQDAHTFSDLGKFVCSEKNTDFTPISQVQTDGLLLRGDYRTLTLAIFGQIVTFEEEDVRDCEQEAEDSNRVKDDNEDIDPLLGTIMSPPCQDPESPTINQDIEKSFSASSPNVDIYSEKTHQNASQFDAYENSSSIKSDPYSREKDNLERSDFNQNSEEIRRSKSSHKDSVDEVSSSEGGYKNSNPHRCSSLDRRIEEYVNSREDNPIKRQNRERTNLSEADDSESISKKTVDDCQDDDDDAMTRWFLNVSDYQLEPLIHFADPSFTLQERSIQSEQKLRSRDASYCGAIEKELKRLRDAFDRLNCSDGSKSEDWVVLIEALTNDIANMSLNQFLDDQEVLNCLIQEVCHGLDFELALKQKLAPFKVRHLRAGLKLATILFHCGDTAVNICLKHAIPRRVLQLYAKDQMSLPMKLLIFKCLSAACDSIPSIENLIYHKYNWSDTFITLNSLKDLHKDAFNLKPSLEDSDIHHKAFQESVDEMHSQDLMKQSRDQEVADMNDNFDDKDENNEATCYQYMLRLLLTKPKTRVTMAIGNIFKKIRLYQYFAKLYEVLKIEHDIHGENSFDIVSKFKDFTMKPIENIVQVLKDDCLSITQPVRHLPAQVQFQIKPQQGDPFIAVFKWFKHFNIFGCIHVILNHIDNISSADFEDSVDLVSIQYLCLDLLQAVADNPRGVHLMLSEDCYLETSAIIEYLVKNEKPRMQPQLSVDAIDNYARTNTTKGQIQFSKRCQDLALRLVYSIEVYSCIDKLFTFHKDLIANESQSNIQDPECILHRLLIISDHPYGLDAILKHFSYIGNLDCLLRFIDMQDDHKQLEFVKEIAVDYSLELLTIFMKVNTNLLEISDEYLETLIELSKTKDKNLSNRIKLLIPWLNPSDADQPLPFLTYSEDSFKHLVKVIRKSIPNHSIPFAKGLNFELPPQMISAVRALQQLCISPKTKQFIANIFDTHSTTRFVEKINRGPLSLPFVDSFPHFQNQNLSWNMNNQQSKNQSETNFYEDSLIDQSNQINQTFKLYQPYANELSGELKYHFGIMQLIEQGGLKRLLNTLRELVGNYPKPIYQTGSLTGLRGRVVLSYIESVITLIHSIICHLIDAQGSEFKDTSVILVVLEIYSLLSFVPKPRPNQATQIDTGEEQLTITSLQNSINIELENFRIAQRTKNMILSILLSYTQLCLSVSESEDKVISKSLWTRMLKEVIEFTQSTPIAFKHGLEVLTRILPAPLPNASIIDSIDQEQLFRSINHRKLWSAHLHPLHNSIEQIISDLSICYNSRVRFLLTYLTNQLCDLSSTTANMVAKTIIESIITYSNKAYANRGFQSSKTSNGESDSPLSFQQQSQSQNITISIEDKLIPNWAVSDEGLVYIMKLILNLISNLLTNKSFETAFTNQFQSIAKKDDKFLVPLRSTLSLLERNNSKQPEDTVFSIYQAGSSNTNGNVLKILDDIIAMANSIKDSACKLEPPEVFMRINLMDLSRKTSDRFSVSSGLKRSYRLKVLLDFTTNTHHRTNEVSGTSRYDSLPGSAHNPAYVGDSRRPTQPPFGPQPVSRSRPRPPNESFRNRIHNSSSRPPSIHVDEFMSNQATRSRYQRKFPAVAPSSSSSHYRY